jgi:hypothetical protein
MTDKVDRLAEQEAVLAAKLKSTREERLREEARLASRRAELVGKVVLKQVKEGKLEANWLRELLGENLSRKADRALFDLNRAAEDERVLEPEYSGQQRIGEGESETADSADEVGLAAPTASLGH